MTHTSSVKHLKTIWTLEESKPLETPNGPYVYKIASVFFEFIQSKNGEEAHNYMDRVCYDASKMDLQPDCRIPKMAAQGFCWGFQDNGTVEQLIKKVESAMTWSNSPEYEVSLTPIDASQLKDNPSMMPAKDYSDVFCCVTQDRWS